MSRGTAPAAHLHRSLEPLAAVKHRHTVLQLVARGQDFGVFKFESEGCRYEHANSGPVFINQRLHRSRHCKKRARCMHRGRVQAELSVRVAPAGGHEAQPRATAEGPLGASANHI